MTAPTAAKWAKTSLAASNATGFGSSASHLPAATTKNIAYSVHNVKLLHRVGPEWPGIPVVSNVLVTTDRLIEYTNNTPAKTGFYRLKTKLE